jgi:hypothetical protein
MNFILGTDDIKLGLFPEKQPYSSQTIAFVYTNSQELMLTIKDGQQLTTAELKYGKYNKRHRIDTSTKTIDFTKEHPSLELVETFIVQVTLSFRVNNPELILRNRRGDYSKLIKDQLFYAISDITKKYAISNYQRVSYDIEGLKNDINLTQNLDNIGLSVVNINANVELSEKSKADIERKNRLNKDAQYEGEKIRIGAQLTIQETQANSAVQAAKVEGLAAIQQNYGTDGLLITLAESNKEVAQIIKESQERTRKQQEETQRFVKILLDKGLSISEINTMLLQTQTPQQAFALNPAQALPAQPANTQIEEPKPMQEDTDEELYAELAKVITPDKGE